MIITHKQTNDETNKKKELNATIKIVYGQTKFVAMKKVWWSSLLCLQEHGNNEMLAKNFIEIFKILWIDSYLTLFLAFSLNNK